jgi:single-strand DNA-binding protein
MKNSANVRLVGHVADYPEITYLDNDLFVCNFTVAVNHSQDLVSFFKVKAWNKVGHISHAIMKKGIFCVVEGTIRIDKYTENEITKLSPIVIAHHVDTPLAP